MVSRSLAFDALHSSGETVVFLVLPSLDRHPLAHVLSGPASK